MDVVCRSSHGRFFMKQVNNSSREPQLTLHVVPLAFLLQLSHTLAVSPAKPKGPISKVTDFLYWKKHVASWYWKYTY